MPGGMRVVCHVQNGLLVLAVLVGTLGGGLWLPDSGQAMQEAGGTNTDVRFMHGIADAGPLDVYVDGSLALIGIVFTDTSGDLSFPTGEHEIAVVQSGATLGDAVATGTITLQSDSRSYIALLGTIDAARVGLFPIDDRPLAQGSARFRVINGVPDAGAIVTAFAGGEALSEPIAFGDASQYAAIDGGVYDFDILEAASGIPLLNLPQTPLAAGTTTDLFLVGQVSDASILALVNTTEVEIAPVTGRSVQVISGDCENREDAIADLGVVQPGQGDPVGVLGTEPVAQGFGIAGIPFAALLAAPHAITVSEDGESGGDVVVCGEIGGTLTDTGAMVIALVTEDSGTLGGIAVLAPALEDPDATSVSTFFSAGLPPAAAAAGSATPVAAIQ